MSRRSKRIKTQMELQPDKPDYAVDAVEVVEDDPDDFVPEPLILYNDESKSFISIIYIISQRVPAGKM